MQEAASLRAPTFSREAIVHRHLRGHGVFCRRLSGAGHAKSPTNISASCRIVDSATKQLQFWSSVSSSSWMSMHHHVQVYPRRNFGGNSWSTDGKEGHNSPSNFFIRNSDHSAFNATCNPNYHDDDDDKGEGVDGSLHSRIHYLLRKIPIGHMHNDDIADARAFLSIVSKWHNENGAMLAEAILERLFKENQQWQKHHHDGREGGKNHSTISIVLIDSEMYNICMDAWNKCKNVVGEKIVHRVESLMSRMEDRFLNGSNHHPHPDRYSYNCVLNAYSKWDGDSSGKVEAILVKMNNASLEEECIRPDYITYHSAMNYYASRKSNRGKAAQRAEDLLLHMSSLSKQGHEDGDNSNNIQVNTTSFNIVLKAWSNSGGGIHDAQRAEAILRMMMKLHGQGHENIKPDVRSFSTVIRSFSDVDPVDASLAVEKVFDLLGLLEGSFIPTSDAVNIKSCYNAAANVFVKNSEVDDAVLQVEGLMNRMKNLDAAPDSNMITSLCLAHVREGNDKSFQRGKNILVEMMKDPDSDEFAPNSKPFNVVLDYVLKSEFANKLIYAAELMTAMEGVGGNARPDRASYNMMISALSRSTINNSEARAVEYMRKILKSYRDGYEKAKPDSFVFNCIISMLVRSKHDWADNVLYRTVKAMENQQTRGNTSVAPDTITYNMVIGKLAQKKTTDNAKKVMALLKHMEDISLSNQAVAPDIITYTSVVQIQSRINPQLAANIASSYIERMMKSREKVQIDQLGLRTLLQSLSQSYKCEHAKVARKAWDWMEKSYRGKFNVLDSSLCNLVIIAYSKLSDSTAADEVYTFLFERIDRWNKGDKSVIFPTVVGLGAALLCLGKQKRIDDALRLLEHARALSDAGVPDIKVDEGCYVMTLNSLAQSHESHPSEQVMRIVKLMKGDFGTVTTGTLNLAMSILYATAVRSQTDKRKAIEASLLLFQFGRESASCDANTYGLMIRNCIDLTEDENTRVKLVEVSFVTKHTHMRRTTTVLQ